jgi:hypothetical protein
MGYISFSLSHYQITPSQPSPTGEGVPKTFPPWGKMKGGKNLKKQHKICH